MSSQSPMLNSIVDRLKKYRGAAMAKKMSGIKTVNKITELPKLKGNISVKRSNTAKNPLFSQRIPGIAALLLAPMAYANGIDVDVAATSRFTDNARRTQTKEMSERQDEYSARLATDYENSLIDFDADYRASENQFNKESQPDRSMLEGNAALVVGKASDVANLTLTHSRRSVLGAPDQVDLLQNEDEREIYSAAPELRARVSSVDNILLRGNFSSIDYRFAEQFNSERKSGYLIWEHKLSALDSLALNIEHSTITYDESSDNSYDYESATVIYETQLRHLRYLLSFGYNLSNPEVGETFSSPDFRLEAEYNSGFNLLSLYLNQKITDTSQGGANRGELGEVNLGDTGALGVDQFESRVAEIRWQNRAVCNRCSLSLNFLFQDDQYQTLSEDNIQRVFSGNFTYQLSRRSTLGLQTAQRQRSFAENVGRESFTVTSYGVDYQYTFINDLSVRVFVYVDDSDSDAPSLTYAEHVSGLTMSYSF